MWHFRQANGTELSRWTGGVSIYVAGLWTIDEVVFGEPNDLTLLGARSLEGLNVRVDPIRKILVDAGPSAGGGRRWVVGDACGYTRSGTSRSRLPVASKIALAIAPGIGDVAASPAPTDGNSG